MVSLNFISLLWVSFLILISILVNEIQSQHENKTHEREKRFIWFNTQSPPIVIGFIINIPLMFALPTFNLKPDARRFRRDSGNFNMSNEDILPLGSYDDPSYTQELNKMTSYFSTLYVEEDICQQRILCDIFTQPDNYRPLSDLFMKKLTANRGLVEEKMSNRYWRYITAMEDGLLCGERQKCQNLYLRCPYSLQDRVHEEALKFWNLLTSKFPIEFHD